MGGFYLGFGLAAILLAQPMVYLALGASFAVAAFGRILSMMSDRGGAVRNLHTSGCADRSRGSTARFMCSAGSEALTRAVS